MAERGRIGVGMIGAGFLAATRARCYETVSGVDARVVAVASRTREKASAYAARHAPDALVCDDVEALLAVAEVDVVDLCVPNRAHRQLAEAAAARGKHVICTKPLTAYVGQDLSDDATDEEISGRNRRVMLDIARRDADAMVRAAESASIRLCYGENWLYAPSIVRARELLAASGGRILEMRGWESHLGSHSHYAKSWRHTGGGALLRLGAHPIGAMLHLKRDEGTLRDGRPIRPIAVTAEVADLTQVKSLEPAVTRVATGWQDVENWGCVVITFEDGARGVAYGSDNQLGGMESKLEVLASNCHLKCNLSPNDLLRAYAPDGSVFGEEYLMEKLDSSAGWSTPMPNEDWTSGQSPMIQAFCEAIATNQAAAADGVLGRDVVEVIYAAYLSAGEGRRVEL